MSQLATMARRDVKRNSKSTSAGWSFLSASAESSLSQSCVLAEIHADRKSGTASSYALFNARARSVIARRSPWQRTFAAMPACGKHRRPSARDYLLPVSFIWATPAVGHKRPVVAVSQFAPNQPIATPPPSGMVGQARIRKAPQDRTASRQGSIGLDLEAQRDVPEHAFGPCARSVAFGAHITIAEPHSKNGNRCHESRSRMNWGV
jgi:hypothetical protein